MNTLPLAEWLNAEFVHNALENSASPLAVPRAVPRYRCIYEGIRKAILSKRLSAGARLPSTRSLAAELKVSRNTVIAAFDQLLAEGYIEASTGSGTFVAHINPPSEAVNPHTKTNGADSNSSALNAAAAPAPVLAARGQRILNSGAGNAQEIQPFVPGMDDFSLFPLKLWQRLQNKYWRAGHDDLLDYGAAGGYRPLRRAIANYLSISRSVQVDVEQVLITSGTQQSLQLCAQMLASAGDLAWMEDPGYWGARKVFEASDLALRPIAVDNEGMRPSADDLATQPRLIYVTPSHQYPTGAVMSLPRRRQLLDFASAQQAWILEDDYDSEFRYTGRPLSSLQGLDTRQCVIYLGTFSKTVYPGIKIGYMVVPESLVAPMKAALYDLQRPGQVMLQAALADFIEQGHFSTLVRKTRQTYGERRELLVNSLKPILGARASISEEESGLHLVIELPLGSNDADLAARAAKKGLVVRPLSSYYLNAGQPGLVVGYAYVPTARIAYYGALLGNVVVDGLDQQHRA